MCIRFHHSPLITHHSPLLTLILVAGVAWLSNATPASAQVFLGKGVKDWEKELKEGKDTRVRRSAAFALGKLGSRAFAAAGSLKKALKDDEQAGVREAAATALGEIGRGSVNATDAPDLIASLVKALSTDTDALVRRSAAVALGHFASDAKSAQKALEAALGDPNPAVRQNVAWALGRLGPTAVAALRKAMKDDDPLVKRDAAGSLGLLADDDFEPVRDALPELLACCQENSSELRIAALSVLNKIVTSEDTKVAAAIRPALKDKDLEVRQNAALTLANIGGTEAAPALPILLDALNEGNPELKQQAATAIGNIGPEAATAVPQLLKALAAPDSELRRNAAYALGGIGEKAEGTIAALVKMLANPGETKEARVEAAVALSKIGARPAAEEAVPTLLKVLEDPKTDTKVRERVLWALRVHKLKLRDFPGVFPAFTKILSEAQNADQPMLRYDCAYMLGVLQGPEAPDKALDVLLEFLKNDKILIFKGKVGVAAAGTVESKSGVGSLKEEGVGDGRVMAVQALQWIAKGTGADRVVRRNDIIVQLQALAANPKTFAELKEKTKELLSDLGK